MANFSINALIYGMFFVNYGKNYFKLNMTLSPNMSNTKQRIRTFRVAWQNKFKIKRNNTSIY